MKGFSVSMKRCTVVFTDPGVGRSIYQEHEGCVDEALRRAMRAAKKAFQDEYRKPVTQADIDREVQRLRDARAKQEVGL